MNSVRKLYLVFFIFFLISSNIYARNNMNRLKKDAIYRINKATLILRKIKRNIKVKSNYKKFKTAQKLTQIAWVLYTKKKYQASIIKSEIALKILSKIKQRKNKIPSKTNIRQKNQAQKLINSATIKKNRSKTLVRNQNDRILYKLGCALLKKGVELFKLNSFKKSKINVKKSIEHFNKIAIKLSDHEPNHSNKVLMLIEKASIMQHIAVKNIKGRQSIYRSAVEALMRARLLRTRGNYKRAKIFAKSSIKKFEKIIPEKSLQKSKFAKHRKIRTLYEKIKTRLNALRTQIQTETDKNYLYNADLNLRKARWLINQGNGENAEKYLRMAKKFLVLILPENKEKENHGNKKTIIKPKNKNFLRIKKLLYRARELKIRAKDSIINSAQRNIYLAAKRVLNTAQKKFYVKDLVGAENYAKKAIFLFKRIITY